MELVGKAAFSRKSGVDRSTVTRLIQEGVIPFHNGFINPEEAMRAIEESRTKVKNKIRAPDTKNLRDARLFREKYAGLRMKLEYDRASNALVPTEEVLKSWQDILSVLRARLLSLPSRLAPQLVGHDINEIKEQITIVIYEALEELSSHGRDGMGTGPRKGMASPTAPTTSDDQPVGEFEPTP